MENLHLFRSLSVGLVVSLCSGKLRPFYFSLTNFHRGFLVANFQYPKLFVGTRFDWAETGPTFLF